MSDALTEREVLSSEGAITDRLNDSYGYILKDKDLLEIYNSEAMRYPSVKADFDKVVANKKKMEELDARYSPYKDEQGREQFHPSTDGTSPMADSHVFQSIKHAMKQRVPWDTIQLYMDALANGSSITQIINQRKDNPDLYLAYRALQMPVPSDKGKNRRSIARLLADRNYSNLNPDNKSSTGDYEQTRMNSKALNKDILDWVGQKRLYDNTITTLKSRIALEPKKQEKESMPLAEPKEAGTTGEQLMKGASDYPLSHVIR